MSFPKAKIHRFNEDTSCAPPPGRYDPKLDSKIKGPVFPSSKRFPDQMCTSSSLDSLNKPTSTQLLPTFRTPQIKKKVILTPRLKYLQDKNFDTPGSDSSSISAKSDEKLMTCGSKKDITRADYQRLENELAALADKHLSALFEKDMEISTLKEDLNKIKVHENKLQMILAEKSRYESERNSEIIELKSNLEEISERIIKERQDNQEYVQGLKRDISLLQSKKEDLEGVLEQKMSAIIIINDKYLELENKIKVLSEEKQEFENEILKIKESHSVELDNVVLESELKVDEIEQKLILKTSDLEKEFNTVQEKIQVDFYTKLNVEVYELTTKKEELEMKMEKCFKEVKELREMVELKTKEYSKNIQEFEESCKVIHRDLCKVEEERDELVISDVEHKLTIIEIKNKSDAFEKKLEESQNKCRIYEITLNNMQETVDALSVRLLESENDVERLSKVEVDLETQKNVLEEKSLLLIRDISALRESMDRMEKDIICDVTILKEHLGSKVEYFKAEASKQIGILNGKIKEKQYAIDMLVNENNYYKKEFQNKEDHITNLQHKINKYKEDLISLRQNNLINKSEKERMESLYSAVKMDNKTKSQEIEKLTLKLESIERSLKNAEEKITVIDEAKSTLELQLIETENTAFEQKSNMSETITQLKIRNHELQSMLTSAKERIKTEIPNLEHDNINKAECILQLSMNIDNLKDSLDESITKIACLEAEKSSLGFQLEETLHKVSNLKTTVEDKNIVITELNKQIQVAEENYNNHLVQMENLHNALNKQNEQLKLGSNNNVKLLDLEERCSEFEKKHFKLDEANTELQNANAALHDQLSVKQIEVANLKTAVDEKNVVINELNKQLQLEEENNNSYLVQMENLHNDLNKQNEQLKLRSNNDVKLLDLEERCSEFEKKYVKLDEANTEFQNANAALHDQLLVKQNEVANLKTAVDEKNIVINELNKQLQLEKENNNSYLVQMKNLHNAFNKQHEQLKLRANNDVKLLHLEEVNTTLQNANAALQLELSVKQIELTNLNKRSETLESENLELKDCVEEMRLRLQVAEEERNKLNKELAESLGHQNIRQKIKHVNQLKQMNLDLKQKCETLEFDNSRLKNKLVEYKENEVVSKRERSPKVLKPRSAQKAASPAVLRDRNQ